MYDYDGRPPFDEPRGRETKGEGPFYRCYRASDRWFFLAGEAPALSRLAESPHFRKAFCNGTNDVAYRLQSIFSVQTASFWSDALSPFQLAVQPLELLANVREHAIAEAHPGSTVAFLRTSSHPCGRMVEHVLPVAIRPTNAKLVDLKAAEKYGQSTRRLLTEIGYSSAECDQMMSSRVVSESWCEEYFPE
jgi:crotonobetainyl-CoA:carnitine CoA-transferase CaiB-like acyl-CoA transferase